VACHPYPRGGLIREEKEIPPASLSSIPLSEKIETPAESWESELLPRPGQAFGRTRETPGPVTPRRYFWVSVVVTGR